MSGLADRTINQALADSRGLQFLNDSDNSATGIYKDAALLPIAAFVAGEIEDEFAKYSIPVKEKIDPTSFGYTAEATTIPIPGGITDFRHPIELWEKPTSSTRWTFMHRVDALPAPPPASRNFIGEWEWSEDTIKVNKCNTNRDVLVRYRRQVTYPSDGDPTTPGGEDYYWSMVAGVASYAASGTQRPELASRADGIYRKRMFDAILVVSRDMQSIEVRQQSVNSRQRGRGWVQE